MAIQLYKANNVTSGFHTNPIKTLPEISVPAIQQIKTHFGSSKPLTEEILQLVREWLKFYFRKHEKRYQHSISTGVVAEEIAMIIDYTDPIKARLVGLLHDIAKTPVKKILKTITREKFEKLNNRLEQLGIELLEPELIFYEDKRDNIKNLHAPIGMLMAEKKLGIQDYEVLNAIRYHTLGFDIDNLDVLSRIIILADKIEPVKRGHVLYNESIDMLRVTKDLDSVLNVLRNKQ